MTFRSTRWAYAIVLSAAVTGCGYTVYMNKIEAQREKVLKEVPIGTPLIEAQRKILQESGVSTWNGFWDYPDEESGESIFNDCSEINECAIEPELTPLAPNKKIDWRQYAIIRAYHLPPSLGSQGPVMYLVFDRETKLLLAKVFWPKDGSLRP